MESSSKQREVRRLGTIADVALIATCLIVGCVVVARYVTSKGSGSPASKGEYKVGEQIVLPGVDFSLAERTVVLALREGCVYCQRSMPFYRSLAALEAHALGRLRFVVVSFDSIQATAAYLKAEGLSVNQVLSLHSGNLKIHATPTLLIVDRNGGVIRTQVGLLSHDEQDQVRREVR